MTVGGLLTLHGRPLFANGASVTADGGILFNPPDNRGFMLDGGSLTNAAGQTATWTGSNSYISAEPGYVFNNLGTFLVASDGTFANTFATSYTALHPPGRSTTRGPSRSRPIPARWTSVMAWRSMCLLAGQ